jgi:hypothetical protein
MDDEFNPANVSVFNKFSCFYDKNIGEIFEFFLLIINFTDSNFFESFTMFLYHKIGKF